MKKIIAAVLVSSLGLMACNTTPSVIPNSQVRFVNTVQDSTGVNIFFGEDKINGTTPVPFKNSFPSATTYRTVVSGTLAYRMCLDDLYTCTKPSETIALGGDKLTSVFLLGTKSATDDTGVNARPIEIISAVTDTAAPASGKIKIRVLHTATLPAANMVDIYITAPQDNLAGLPPQLSYKGIYDYRELAAGSYRIRATAVGVTSTALVDSDTLTLEAGKVYTAVITNPENGKGVILLTDK